MCCTIDVVSIETKAVKTQRVRRSPEAARAEILAAAEAALGASDFHALTVDEVMRRDPVYWRSYYRGDEERLRFARQFSFSDRIRYYWPQPEPRAAYAAMIAMITTTITSSIRLKPRRRF